MSQKLGQMMRKIIFLGFPWPSRGWDSRLLLQGSLVAQAVKRLPTTLGTRVQSLGQEDLLEKEMVTHSSILAWKIHGPRSLVGYRCIQICIQIFLTCVHEMGEWGSNPI